jgi:glycerol-3-phosphate dehydrogenase
VDERSGRAFRLRARHVVNATGVWADSLAPQVQLTPSKGAHLVLSAARLGNPRAALTVPVPGTLSRFVFLLPQGDGRVYLGLTDEPATRVEDVPAVDEADREFLLRVASRALETTLTDDDVIGSYAGLRPLVRGAAGATADLSREHAIFQPESGLLTIVGGKLTTYRRMAEDVVDRFASAPCVTKATPLVGASARLASIDAPPHLLSRYGAEAPIVTALADARPPLRERVLPSLPYLRAELRFAIEHEGALTAEDLVDRRTRIGLVSGDRDEALSVAEAMLAGG